MIEKTIERADAALRFHTVKTDRFKMSRLSFNFILPVDAEGSPRTRLMLATMMRGCEKYPSIAALNRRADELYGANIVFRFVDIGEKNVVRIACDMLSDRYRFADDKESIVKNVCELVLETLFEPLRGEDGLFSAANFESERGLAIDAIKSKINNQKAYAADRCKSLMLQGTPAGINTEGTIEILEGFTLEEITENQKYFLKNSLIECYYFGNDDVSEVIDLISERFATVGRDARELWGEETAFVREGDIRFYEETMNVSQSRLNIGCTSGVVLKDSDYPAMVLFNEIFGGSSVAKLFMNVREKHSLCYYCYSSYGSATGTLMIGCGIKRDNREKAYAEIEKQLREMQEGNFSDEEIATAKRSVISGHRQVSDSHASMEAFNIRRILGGVEESVEEAIDKIDCVTKEEIVAAAKKVRFDTVYFLCGEGEEEEEYDE